MRRALETRRPAWWRASASGLGRARADFPTARGGRVVSGGSFRDPFSSQSVVKGSVLLSSGPEGGATGTVGATLALADGSFFAKPLVPAYDDDVDDDDGTAPYQTFTARRRARRAPTAPVAICANMRFDPAVTTSSVISKSFSVTE